MNRRDEVRKLASDSIARGDAVGWFEELYGSANGDWSRIPWADLAPNANLLDWLRMPEARACGPRALVVGCGLGDDAEALAAAGFTVVAFDVSATAVAACERRFPRSQVRYVVADLFAPPPDWKERFDFVFESYTLQVLPESARRAASGVLVGLVAPGGKLLVLCRGRDCSDAPGELPWPLTREELTVFSASGLRELSFTDFADAHETPPVRRFLGLYEKPR